MKRYFTVKAIRSVFESVNVLRCCLVLAAAVLFPACADKAGNGSEKDIAGMYTLALVNSAPVPVTISHEGVKVQIRSGSFTISPDGICTSRMVFVPPTGSETTREVTATYTKKGPELTMKWKGAGITVGQVTGDTFTMNNEGMVLAYRK